jgi:hypothetical protein
MIYFLAVLIGGLLLAAGIRDLMRRKRTADDYAPTIRDDAPARSGIYRRSAERLMGGKRR